MRIAVVGMWHQGPVTAACLAHWGHTVVAIDEDPGVVAALRKSKPPVAEPGLSAMIESECRAGRLRFSTQFEDVRESDIVWIAYDTPVDHNDQADVEFVHRQSVKVLAHAGAGAVVVLSSQMPVGSAARIEKACAGRSLSFASAPENLRLGKAMDVFLRPDRVVVGVRDPAARALLETVFAPAGDRIEWMSVESAEMTKHAINAFLAASICFINEIATLCESTGADAAEVERGLKTDLRIGPRAYLHAGGAIAGGTLIRDIGFLRSLGGSATQSLPLIDGVHSSNENHKNWLPRKILSVMSDLAGRRFAILGLTYKPGTDTLRRSPGVEAAQWLASQAASVQGYDPHLHQLPAELQPVISLKPAMAAAMEGADALIVMTPCEEFRAIDPSLSPPLVFDAGRFLESVLRGREGIHYFSIGSAH
jgi:UDPglucose 6-dehydrogenase